MRGVGYRIGMIGANAQVPLLSLKRGASKEAPY